MTGARLTGDGLAFAAQALVGVPFRLHGRDPATGLDCIGVFAAAFAAAGGGLAGGGLAGGGAAIPNGYCLRSRSLPDLSAVVAACGFVATTDAVRPGDVVMVRVGPCQFHLAVAARASSFVHAHAGLRRVVQMPGPLAWPLVHHWRLAPTD